MYRHVCFTAASRSHLLTFFWEFSSVPLGFFSFLFLSVIMFYWSKANIMPTCMCIFCFLILFYVSVFIDLGDYDLLCFLSLYFWDKLFQDSGIKNFCHVVVQEEQPCSCREHKDFLKLILKHITWTYFTAMLLKFYFRLCLCQLDSLFSYLERQKPKARG